MKQGINKNLSVSVDYDYSLIDKIEFLFKQQRNTNAKVLKTSTYKSDGTGDVTYNSTTKLYLVPFTAKETYSFVSNATFYMDTRITLKDSDDQPETGMVALKMNDTLFSE